MKTGGTRGTAALVGITLGIIVTAFSAARAYAHEGWVAGKGMHPGEGFPIELTSLSAIMSGVGFLVVGLAFTRANLYSRVDAAAMAWQRFLPNGMEWRLIAVLAGIMLIANSSLGVFLAADLPMAEGGFGQAALAAQVLIGLLLLSQVSFALAGLLVFVVAIPTAFVAFPPGMLIDYVVEYAALALALVFVGLSSCPDQLACKLNRVDPKRFSHLPLPTIRIGFGLSLIVLAFHNKLADPNLALTLLDLYNLNFVSALGLTGFSNLHFAFAAGLLEVGLGVLLVAGVATRLAAAVLFSFFCTTFLIFGVTELVGHLPLFGIALALIYRGSGTFSLETMWARKMPR